MRLRAHQPPLYRHLKILGKRPGDPLRNGAAAKALLRRARTKREAWRRGWKGSGTPAGLLGNMTVFNTVEVQNLAGSFHKFGKWIPQDPDFPDTILSGSISPMPMLKYSKHPTIV